MTAEKVRAQTDALLTAAWLATTDDDGDPGEWCPGRYLPIGEVNEVEVAVYPAWRVDMGGSRWWVNSPRDGAVEAWRWEDEACDWASIDIPDGPHNERPPLTDEVVAYLTAPPEDPDA